MRIFQNSGINAAYRKHFVKLPKQGSKFSELRDTFLADRYGASHILAPIYDGSPEGFFTNGDDDQLQRAWARENGLSSNASLREILLAQIEEHRTEVFYNLDPMRYPSDFLKSLPGCVRHSLCWRAAPSANVDFGGYDKIVCNFPAILESYRQNGWEAAYFCPAHDPELDAYARESYRAVDLMFVGTYSQHHAGRVAALEKVAALATTFNIDYRLNLSRMTMLAETPFGWVGPLRRYRRPDAIRRVSRSPVFGRTLYGALSQARIVLNGSIDMAGNDRGNMRCWEAMGSGALLLTNEGNYPEGMVDGETMVTYRDGDDAIAKIHQILGSPEIFDRIAKRGHAMISGRYSKSVQFDAFTGLIG